MDSTGHTGREITQGLLKSKNEVRAIVSPLDSKKSIEGATMHIGNADEAEFLTRAFRGADAAFVTLAANPTSKDFRKEQDRTTEAIVKAIKDSGIKRAVVLSSVGADVNKGIGAAAGLHALEERFKNLTGVSTVFLRAAYPLENAYDALVGVFNTGKYGDALKGDVAVPMVAAKDVASLAVQSLVNADMKGIDTREILGARDYTLQEVTAALGKAIGRDDLAYTQIPYDKFVTAQQELGISQSVAGLTSETAKAINDGVWKSATGRSKQNTSVTTLEQFIPGLATAFKAITK